MSGLGLGFGRRKSEVHTNRQAPAPVGDHGGAGGSVGSAAVEGDICADSLGLPESRFPWESKGKADPFLFFLSDPKRESGVRGRGKRGGEPPWKGGDGFEQARWSGQRPHAIPGKAP